MQENYSIANHLAGIVHVNELTGALSWEQKSLDPVIQRTSKGIFLMKALLNKRAADMLDRTYVNRTGAPPNSLAMSATLAGSWICT